jgi:hypothetical protein
MFGQLPRAERIQIAHAFRSVLVTRRKPGRQQHAQITAAVEMRDADKSWADVSTALIPFEHMAETCR